MGELWRWPATDLAAAIRDGAISSREAVTDCLARIHSVNPTLNALVEMQGGGDEEDAIDQMWAAVRQLPDKQREAVTLVYGEGLSHAAAAEAMAVSEATVSWHVHEAKKRLRVLMREVGEV